MDEPTSLPPLPKTYWHLWTGDDGISRQTMCRYRDFASSPLNPGVPPSGVRR